MSTTVRAEAVCGVPVLLARGSAFFRKQMSGRSARCRLRKEGICGLHSFFHSSSHPSSGCLHRSPRRIYIDPPFNSCSSSSPSPQTNTSRTQPAPLLRLYKPLPNMPAPDILTFRLDRNNNKLCYVVPPQTLQVMSTFSLILRGYRRLTSLNLSRRTAFASRKRTSRSSPTSPPIASPSA